MHAAAVRRHRAAATAVGMAFPSKTQTSVSMVWAAATDNVGVAGYHVYRNSVRVASMQQLAYTFTGLACGTQYTFAYEAYDAAGDSTNRAEATGTTSTNPCSSSPPPPPPPPAPVPGPGPGSGLAHLWIDGNGGSCTRSAVPVAYVDAAACGSAGVAYERANASSEGSTILIRGGTYSGFQIIGNRSSSNWIVFDAAPGESPVFTGGYMSIDSDGVSTRGPDYVVLRNLTTAQFGAGAPNPDNRYGVYVGPGSTHIRLENLRAGTS